MLTPQQIIDLDYLETRCSLLEIAAVFDRYDAAVERTGMAAEDVHKLDCLREAMTLLVDPASKTDRAEQLLNLFAKV